MNTEDVISTKEMTRLDENTEGLGIPKLLLMELAGSRTACFAIAYYSLVEGNEVSIICGSGNNGGDGLVAARHLASRGIISNVYLISDKMATDIGQKNLDALRQLTDHVNIKQVCLINLTTLKDDLSKSKVIIDGLLGTGVSGALREPVRSVIELLNQVSAEKSIPILSIDVPSGMNPDTGEIGDIAINDDSIVTFHKKKIALKDFPSIMSLAEILSVEKAKHLTYVANIGIPPEAENYCGIGDLKMCLPHRRRDAYKGQYGKLLVIGGSINYSGAPALAALAALQIGVDLVMVLTVEKVSNAIRSYSPDLIVREVPGNHFSVAHIPTALELMAWADCVLIGPGLSRHQDVKLFLKQLLSQKETFKKKIVFDADALSIIAEEKQLDQLPPCLLTPHRGEMGKLLGGIPATETIIMELIKKFDGYIIAKGPIDLIITNSRVIKNRTGCPEMSVGGTGDVLAGICSAFLALGNSYKESACAGAFLTGKIGELYVKNVSKAISSSGLIKIIPTFFASIEKKND